MGINTIFKYIELNIPKIYRIEKECGACGACIVPGLPFLPPRFNLAGTKSRDEKIYGGLKVWKSSPTDERTRSLWVQKSSATYKKASAVE